MSQDYPFYEELCRREHRGAKWWLIGDCFYYLGSLPAVASIPGAAAATIAGLSGRGWTWLTISAVTFVGGAAVFITGIALKRHAYDLARRDGINVDDS